MKDEILTAIVKEIGLQKKYLGVHEISTIYFGGGTPSILAIADVEKILNSLYESYTITEHPEITLEANPDDLTLPKLEGLRSLGINRLSIGIQTFNDAYLKFLNRAHDANMALQCVKRARQAGFQNISIDLIYGINEDKHRTLADDLKTAIDIAPEHISAYCLTIEPQTAFGAWVKKNKMQTVNEEFAAEEFVLLADTLAKNNYEQYEISNFAKPGYYSRHNSNYWRHIPYLGIGPSAHSFNGKERQYNVANNAKYLKSISNNCIPFEKEILEGKNLANELIMTGLRTKWGCDLSLLKNEYQYDLQAQNRELLKQYEHDNLIRITEDRIFLTDKGKLLADEIAAKLFWV